MKKAVRISSIALAGLMAVGTAGMLSSCNKGENTAEGLVSFAYKEPVEISVLWSDDGANTFPEGMDFSNSTWVKAYKEKLNIDIKTAGTISAYEYPNKVAQMMSSNTLPDLFQVDSASLEMMATQGYLADLTEINEKEAGELAKKYYEYDGGVALNSCKVGDKLYAIPKMDVVYDSVTNIAIRTDWLDNLGMEEPKSWDDVLKIIEAFATRDPDGDGKKNTYGLALDNMVGDGILKGVSDAAGFFYAYHAPLGRWVDDGKGNAVYGTTMDTMKKPLSVLADLFKKGCIDPSYTEKDRWEIKKDIQAGKVGVAFQGFWGAANWDSLYETLGDKLKFYPLMSFDDAPVTQYLMNMATTAKMGVSAKCEHPEAIMKILNLELLLGADTTENWSQYFEGDSTKAPHRWMIVMNTYAPDGNINRYKNIQAVLNGEKKEDELPYSDKKDYERVVKYESGEDTSKEAWSAYMNYGSEYSTYAVINDAVENKHVQFQVFQAPLTPSMSKYNNTLQWEEIGMVNAIIKGEQTVDYFDTWVANWKKMGGQKVTDEVNEWYKNNKK